MLNFKDIPLPQPELIENEQREVVVALRQDGVDVGAINVTKIVNNLLDGFFRPTQKDQGLRVVK